MISEVKILIDNEPVSGGEKEKISENIIEVFLIDD